MPSAEPPVLAPCPLHRSRLVIHPIGRRGSEFSTNFLRLVRQSALLKSHVVKSGVTSPRRRRCASGFSGRIVHASTNPISGSVALSLLLCCCHCCPLIEALLDAPCISFALPVRLVHLSRRAVNPLLGCSSGKPVQDQLA